jgi:hypothetical protein
MTSASTHALPRTAARSQQLVAASERTTLDPFRAVDWSLPIDDSAYHLPPELLPLYGTAAWDAMTDAERIAYSRHELAAVCGAAIWFENALMQVILRHLIEVPVTDPSHRYLLVEVADECRHSTMFGEFIRRAGTPAYGPTHPVIIDDMGRRAMSYLLTLTIEELLDHTNRVTMRDERVHPVSRQMAKLHVLEEARHVSFAKTYLAEVWPQLSDEEQRELAGVAPAMVAAVVELNLDPKVYETLGIDGGLEQALANPAYRQVVIDGLAKLTGFLTEVGMIDDTNRSAWVERGLVAVAEEAAAA